MCNCNGPKSDFAPLAPVLEKYGDSASNLITILQKAQEIYGYLPKDVMYHIAENIGIPPADVVGVATFIRSSDFRPSASILLCPARVQPATLTEAKESARQLPSISESKAVKQPKTVFSLLKTLPASAVAHLLPLL